MSWIDGMLMCRCIECCSRHKTLHKSFRQVPTFGRDTIRRFSNNISELKKLAARDFEDLLQVRICLQFPTQVLTWGLQCAIPVFEGLLPEPHNTTILRLLFTCAHWHALAKLRMHTDQTLRILDDVTTQIGAEFRKFNNETCSAFDTRELSRESEARKRRQLKKGKSSDCSNGLNKHNSSSKSDGPRPKRFNLRTYKYHALGDYPDTIRRFGTTDSYSTEPVSRSSIGPNETNNADVVVIQGELEHRTPKARYKRTDKKLFVKQLAQIERRETRIRRIRAKLVSKGQIESEVVASTPQEHHHIGVSENRWENVGSFIRSHAGDPATQVGTVADKISS
jgi:hypothetical protein